MSTRTVIAQQSPDATRRPTRRAIVVGVAAALLIAAGTYGASRSLGPDSAPQRAQSGSASPQVSREMQDVIVHLYGPRAGATPSDSVARQLRETTIALYGPGR